MCVCVANKSSTMPCGYTYFLSTCLQIALYTFITKTIVCFFYPKCFCGYIEEGTSRIHTRTSSCCCCCCCCYCAPTFTFDLNKKTKYSSRFVFQTSHTHPPTLTHTHTHPFFEREKKNTRIPLPDPSIHPKLPNTPLKLTFILTSAIQQ